MPADYHLHTYLCKHASGSVEEYIRSAWEKEITEICFADHVPSPHGYDPAVRMEMEQFEEYRQLITDAARNEDVNVLFGVEADYYDGCEEFFKTWLPEQNFDLVIGSVHYIENWGFDNPEVRHVWDSVDVVQAWTDYFNLVIKMAESKMYDIVGHIDLPKKFGYSPEEDEVKEMIIPVLDAIAESGMGIEINTSGLRREIGEIYPSTGLLKMSRERDIPISFGSDAHRPQEVGESFAKGIKAATDAGYTECLQMRQRAQNLIPIQ
jgi:histidinol-phosphatase (PHP family)